MDITDSQLRLKEIDEFEKQLGEFQRGEIFEETFTGQRLQLGIYGQRQSDKYMVRVKIPGGRLLKSQLAAIHSALEKYSGIEFVNITTRQDIQFHFVDLENVPPILKLLNEVGLTTREACGNTVRNITACSLAGICPNEQVNVLPYLQGVMQHFLRHPLTQHLPRKFKMSFSGCETDCAQGLIHDLAVIAVRKNNRSGFKILAGGGLGHKPHQAIVLEECVDQKQLLACIEAVLNLHNRYSDRNKRAKSRIKFLVDKFGEYKFRSLYREELTRTEMALKPLNIQEPWSREIKSIPIVSGVPRQIVAQKQAEYVVVPLSIPLGDLSLTTLASLIETMEQFQLNEIRLGQDQNLLLPFVVVANESAVVEALQGRGLAVAAEKDNVVTCPGTWTCRLGITSSREAAKVIAQTGNELRLRVSGCHNGCAQPQVGDIGLHGLAKRQFGKLVPYYRMHFGGNGSDGGKIGILGPEIPSARIRPAISRVQKTFVADRAVNETFVEWASRKTAPFFTELLDDFIVVGPNDLSHLMKDHGERSEFAVVPLGGGECAGVAQETVSAWIAEAKNERTYCDAFLNQNMFESAIDCCLNILRLTALNILHNRGIKGSSDLNQLGNQLALLVHGQSKLIARFHAFVSLIERERKVTTKERLSKLVTEIQAWHESVIELEKQGKLQSITTEKRKEAGDLPMTQVFDFSQEALPSAFLGIRKLLSKSKQGELIGIRIKNDNDGEVIVKGLQSLGYGLVTRQESESTKSLYLVVSNKIGQSVQQPESAEQIASV